MLLIIRLMNITFKQLHVFCALYELRSFTAAARATFITQSAVSKLCTELESEIGQPLFERTTRSVTPCEGAADFYSYAQEILGTLRAAERNMAGWRTLDRGAIGIATSPLMMTGLMGPVINTFHRAYPRIKLDLYELSTDETVEYVRHGRADFGIAVIESPETDLAVRCLYRDSIHVVCPANHPLSRLAGVTWHDIAQHPVVMLRNVYSVRRHLERISTTLGLTFSYHIEAGMLISALTLVASGLGVTVIPGYASSLARQLGLQVLNIVEGPAHDHELWLIQRPSTRLSLAASTLLQATEDYLKDIFHERINP